uniref:PRKCSH domain-containing protein n=1 Tax=Caenorhabditis japonica TaxID=281687 RepID=A0A8R1I5R0_CAEJA
MRSLPLLLVLSLIPAILATSSAGFFDLTEFRRVTYDASIGEDFLWFAPNLDIRQLSLKNIDDFEREIAEKIPEEKDENYVFVTSKGGQKFACSLPVIEHLKKPTATKSSKNPKVYGDLLAASFYVNKCIHLRGNHWWTYTLCRGQTVEQIHGEVGSADYAKNILGIFDGTLTMPPYSESTDDRLLYVEESYTAGTYCDLEDYRQPRRISVRYECEPALSTNEAFIESVVEVKPCNYLMTVKVGTLCSYPEFLPVSQANTRNVACQPYLSKTQVREILEKRLEGQERTDDLEWEEQEARDASKMAERRFAAMTKSARRLYLPDKAKLINAEMDLRAAHFDLLTIGVELAGVKITEERNDAMWKRLNTVGFFDHVLYVNYDNIEDENRAYLWYYFNDPTWPKDQFPKDIYYTAVRFYIYKKS